MFIDLFSFKFKKVTKQIVKLSLDVIGQNAVLAKDAVSPEKSCFLRTAELVKMISKSLYFFMIIL